MKRLASMAPIDTIWLVLNARSGSNEDGAIAELREHCKRRNLSLAREICFPGEDLPTASELDAAGIEIPFPYVTNTFKTPVPFQSEDSATPPSP